VSLRQQWRDFIADPGRAGRHLANLGTGIEASVGDAIEQEVLAAFLAKLSRGTDDIALLAGVVDLLSGGYAEFCARQLPQLLDSLANERVGENAVVGPALRGNTRWDLTTIGRLSGRLSPVQFVSRLPVRSFALPENGLVRWLVEELSGTVAWIERRVGSQSLPRELAGIRDGCEEALRHQWFREVPAPTLLDAHMRSSAQRQRLPAYRRAAALAGRRQRYRERDRAARWRNILDLLASDWLSPVSDDDIFELYALVLVLDLLERDLGLGSPTQLGLAAPRREHIALFEAGEARVRVFFDQSPQAILGIPSYQMAILDAHDGVQGAPRRPDVMIVHESAEHRRVMFLEVKRTSDTGYISDSVYKALGYILDFREIWSSHPSNPKIIVLFPEYIAPKSNVDLAQQEVVLASSFSRVVIATGLRLGLGF
jgi:hypothetical protein